MYYDPSWIFSNKQPEKPQPNITGLMDEDWPPKQKQAEAKPIAELSDIFTKPQPVTQPEPAKKLNVIQQRLFNNLNPVGNGTVLDRTQYGSFLGQFNRVLNAVLLNKKEQDRENLEKAAMDSDNPDSQTTAKRRLDAYRVYMGQPQQYGTLIESAYKPSVSTNKNAKYYTFSNDELANDLFKYIKNESDIKQRLGIHQDVINNVMGDYTLGSGEDEIGKYLSYYDKWDIPMDFGYPFEIYDRIYYTVDKNGNAVRVIPNQTK